MRLLFFFLLFTKTLIIAGVEETTTIGPLITGNLPLSINNLICPISGSLSLSELDAQTPSLCPITIDRSYTSHKSDAYPTGWYSGNAHRLYLDAVKNYDIKGYPLEVALFQGGYGQKTYFRAPGTGYYNYTQFQHDELVFEQGQHNLTGTELSGRTHPKNCNLRTVDGNAANHYFETGAGVKVFFYGMKSREDRMATHKVYPNGHVAVYDYFENRNLRCIETKSRTGKSLSVAKFTRDHNWTRVDLSNGAHCVYENDVNWQATGVYPSDGPHLHYVYDKHRRLIKKIKPEGRELCIEYRDFDIYSPTYRNDRRWENPGRVKSISVPSHIDGSLAKVLTLDYQTADNNKIIITRAIDPWGRYKAYHSVEGKVKLIVQQLPDDSNAYTIGELYWSDPLGDNPGSLLAFAFKGTDRNIIFAKKFIYDDRGNPIKEQLFGNLSGKDESPPRLDNAGNVETPNCEHHTIEKSYYHEKNLLKTEYDGIKTRYLSYHLDTDQIAKELIKVDGSIKERHFFHYDEDLALIQETLDDGTGEDIADLSGITERKILRKKYDAPLTALPTEEAVYFLNQESGEEVLYGRKEIDYDQRGRVIKERAFDGDNTFIFELSREYDQHGNVTREVSALGTEIIRQYDANDNLIYEAGPLFDHEKHYKYDLMDRLIEETEIHGDEVFTTSHTYNIIGQKVKTTDRYGNDTRYDYDFAGRVSAIHESEGRVVQKTYHRTGYVHTLTDPAGGVTTFKQTILGKPYYASYPDGTEESWEYDLMGNLIRHREKEGQIKEYVYDYKGRLLEEKLLDIDGNFLLSSTKTYNPFHLLSETDANGNTLTYEYNFKGQLIRTHKNGLETHFTYNSLGQLTQKTTNDELIERYEYDLIGRIISETKEDSNGTLLLYAAKTYDDAGRTTSETTGSYTTFFVFNSKGEIVEKIAPDGRATHYHYDHNFLNHKGQTVLLKKEIDPKGTVSETEYDALGREVRSSRKNSFEELLQQSFKSYDLLGNLEKVTEEVIYNGEKEKEYVVTFQYDPMGRPKEVTEEKGSLYQKSTFTEYNALGQKIKVTKPNGVVIHYTYDKRGLLTEEKSSDNTVDYTIDYDLFARPTHTHDHIHNTDSYYHYDAEGRLLKEQLATNETVDSRYDARGRLIEVKHDRSDPIHLSYDALYLREVSWKDLKAKYDAYDLSGNLLKGADTTYSYDTACRLTGWKKDQYEETITYDKVGNLAHRKLLDLETSYEYDDLNQLKQESGASNKTYNCDSHYSRRQKDGIDYTLDPLNHPTSYGETEYVWDRNGNLISRLENNTLSEYTYDAKDRLTTFKINGKVQATYQWDEQNRCLKAGERHFLYQARAEVGSVIDNELQDFRVLGLGRGQESAATLWIQTPLQILKPLHDLSGNMVALTDLENTLVEHNPLSAFGEPQNPTDTQISPWGFCSKRIDPHTNLILFGYRFYDPSLGRFTTADPAGFDSGPNLWAYCHNNPLTFSDLFGLSPIGFLNDEASAPSHDEHTENTESKEDENSGPTETNTNSVGNIISESVYALVERVASGIITIGENTIGLTPGLREACYIVRKSNTQGTYGDYHPILGYNESHWISCGNYINGQDIHIHLTGLGTSYADAFERAQQISKDLKNEQVHVYQLGTNGTVFDVLHSQFNKMGFSLETQEKCRKGIEMLIDNAPSDANIRLLAFSRGNILAKNLSAEWKSTNKNYPDRIDLLSLASPCPYESNEFKKVVMHISDQDGVPMLMGSQRWNPPAHLYIHKSDGPFLLDHGFLNSSYQKIYYDRFIKPYKNR